MDLTDYKSVGSLDNLAIFQSVFSCQNAKEPWNIWTRLTISTVKMSVHQHLDRRVLYSGCNVPTFSAEWL